MEQNNLVHIGEMDTETGRLLLTYRETHDVELLRSLVKGITQASSSRPLVPGCKVGTS